MTTINIAIIPRDGIGAEIMSEGIRVLGSADIGTAK